MLTSTKTFTAPASHTTTFDTHVSRRSSFSILRADKTSSAACYGVIALVVLAGIIVNVTLIARSVSSIVNAAQ